MANTLTSLVPKLLAQGLLALRQQAIVARLVNRKYETLAGAKGSTIDVPISSGITAVAVNPGPTPPANADSAPTSVPIAMDQWFEAPFYLTDKERMEIDAGFIPMQASEAIKALANNVDQYLLNLFRGAATPAINGIFNVAGVAGTTPFASDLTAFKNARKLLNKELAPLDERFIVLDPDAEANALDLTKFFEADKRGDQGGVIDGNIGRKYGAQWWMDQNVRTHTSTALSAGAATVNGAHSIGATTVSIAKATNPSNLVKGDILTFAGDVNTYMVKADVTLAVGNTNVTIYPGLRVAKAGAEAVTLTATHVVNLYAHREAIAFANRPLLGTVDPELRVAEQSAVDPISGLVLRLEVTRQHKQTRWSFDILYGGQLIRPEYAVRVLG